MKLYHKEELIRNATKYVGSAFWEEVLIKYAHSLECEECDYYGALWYLSTIKDKDYCGEGLDTRANYYLYDNESKILLWFYTSADAADWANIQNGYSPSYIPKDASEQGYSYARFFEEYRGRQKNGYYWLLPEDAVDLERVISQAPILRCTTLNMEFANRNVAAKWLYNSGRAASIPNALVALNKHLSGKTAQCYKLVFEEV